MCWRDRTIFAFFSSYLRSRNLRCQKLHRRKSRAVASPLARALGGASGNWRVIRKGMKLEEGGRGFAGACPDLAGVRPLGDSQQQADQQIAPEQPSELGGKFGRTACEESGRRASAIICR